MVGKARDLGSCGCSHANKGAGRLMGTLTFASDQPKSKPQTGRIHPTNATLQMPPLRTSKNSV